MRCLALQPDGKILIGGEFDLPPRGLARLNPDGSVDHGFHPPPVPAWDEEGVHALAVLADGRILIGGDLAGVQGGLTSRIARLNSDGSVDPTFDPGVVLEGSPTAFLPTGDGAWIVSGVGVADDNPSRRSVLRLSPTGETDRILWIPSPNHPWPMAIEPTGHILTGGTSVLRLGPRGGLDPVFRAQPSTAGAVNAVLVQADGRIVLGGRFTSINGMPANNLARLNPTPAPPWLEIRRELPGMSLVLQIWGQKNTTYAIEASSNLTEWQAVGTAESSSGMSEFNIVTPDAAHRYYRVGKAE